MDKEAARRSIAEFEAHYDYDGSYMHELLDLSPEGYEKFMAFRPMSAHRSEATPEEYYLAKIAAMQSEDCGSCLQLTVRQALEAGVSEDIVASALKQGEGLDPELADVYRFAANAATNAPQDPERVERLEQRRGRAVIAELALCIAGARVFPTIKRTLLGPAESCSLVSVEL